MKSVVNPSIQLISIISMPNKYRNKKTVVDGMTFDSKKEAQRYSDLKLLERGHIISSLKIQPEFKLHVKGFLVCKYRADFSYTQMGEYIVEDVKSEITRKHPVYGIKKKLMKAVHGIDIKET